MDNRFSMLTRIGVSALPQQTCKPPTTLLETNVVLHDCRTRPQYFQTSCRKEKSTTCMYCNCCNRYIGIASRIAGKLLHRSLCDDRLLGLYI